MARFGVPYAMAKTDDAGEIVMPITRVCPECGEEFVEHFDPKADMGCGAMVSGYAQHYIDEHEEDE